jgi:thymidylate synthase
MKQYLDLQRKILGLSVYRLDSNDRVMTDGILKFNLTEGFPLLTTKTINLKPILDELILFIKKDKEQWDNIVDDIMMDSPCSIVGKDFHKSFHTEEIPPDDMEAIREDYKYKLPRTLTKEEFEARLPKRYLNVVIKDFKNSNFFSEVPHMTAFNATLLQMIASQVNMIPKLFTWISRSVYINTTEVKQMKVQVERQPYPLPQLFINPNVKSITDYTSNDFQLYNYENHPTLNPSTTH